MSVPVYQYEVSNDGKCLIIFGADDPFLMRMTLGCGARNELFEKYEVHVMTGGLYNIRIWTEKPMMEQLLSYLLFIYPKKKDDLDTGIDR